MKVRAQLSMVLLLFACSKVSVDPGWMADEPNDDIAVDAAPSSCDPVSPFETECDGIDDDCNGLIDDVNVANDGICDCLRIGIIGAPGNHDSANFQTWLESRGTSVERIGSDPNDTTTLSATWLQGFNLVVVDQVWRIYSVAEADTLANWISMGGSVMAMNGYVGSTLERDRTNSLLAGLGLSYEGGLLNGPVTNFVGHELTLGLSSVSFYGGYSIAVDTAIASGPITSVATLPAGPVGIASEQGVGRAFIWGDEWVSFDSEWSSIPEIEQFWINVTTWLGPRDICRLVVQ